MSSGSEIKLYVALEESVGVLPAQPEWFIVPRITDSFNEQVDTETSAIVSNSRFRQSAIAVKSQVSATLETDLSVGTFDLFFAAVAMNDWATDSLVFGGSTQKTFTFIKEFTDIGEIRKYSGVSIDTAKLSISIGGIVKASFGMVGTGFERIQANPVSNPANLMKTPLVADINVRDFIIDGQGVVGTACLQSLTLDIMNNLEAIHCISSGKLSAQKQAKKMVDINLTTQFMFSGQVANYSDKIKTGALTSITFSIKDSEDNSYSFEFPHLQVTEAPHPDAGGDELVMQDITFAHVVETPEIVRIIQ